MSKHFDDTTLGSNKLQAMSLIEMSFIMIIAGIFMAMALQGWKYVEHARFYSISQQILQMKVASENMRYTYVEVDNYLQTLETHGGPKTVDGKIKAGTYGVFECTSVSPVTIKLANLKPEQAEKLKGMLHIGDQNDEWIVIKDTDSKSELNILL